MNETVRQGLADEQAKLSRIAASPEAPLLFGVDLDCVTDCTAGFTTVDPASPKAVVQAALRRLTTPRGALIDSADYGYDLRAFANRGVTYQELTEVSTRVASEVEKDDRVARADVTVTAPTPNALRVLVVIEPSDPDLAEFSFTFVVESGSLTMEAIR